MKNLFYFCVFLAGAFTLMQCDDVSAPEVAPAFQESTTSASGKKQPFVIYAVVSDQWLPQNTFDLAISGKPGSSIHVDWGDNSTSEITFDGSPDFTKTYEAPGRYRITVTGDVDQIDFVGSSYGGGLFDSINVSRLRRLVDVTVAMTPGPAVFDLSENKELLWVALFGVPELKKVILPKRHRIPYINVSGPNQISTKEIDDIINNVYDNAVKGKVFGGSIELEKLIYLNDGDEGYGELVGPPSPAAIDKLVELRDVYGWRISPPITE
jgi:hypothetical protein